VEDSRGSLVGPRGLPPAPSSVGPATSSRDQQELPWSSRPRSYLRRGAPTQLLDRQRWSIRVELANATFEYLEILHSRRRRHSALGWLNRSSTKSDSRPILAAQALTCRVVDHCRDQRGPRTGRRPGSGPRLRIASRLRIGPTESSCGGNSSAPKPTTGSRLRIAWMNDPGMNTISPGSCASSQRSTFRRDRSFGQSFTNQSRACDPLS
jgi:hypothetical protein